MKKAITAIAFFSILLILFTAAGMRTYDAVNGAQAPVFRVERPDTVVSLDAMKGDWVLLQFWSSADAPSRIAAREYEVLDTLLSAGNTATGVQFRRLSVNLDRSVRLFREIMRRDGLKEESQFFADGDRSRQLNDAYHLDTKGMNAYLIDPEGKIVAENPSVEFLISKLK